MSRRDSAIERIGKFERDKNLPAGFFEALFKEDDWSFVVKMHAFFEAILTHWIVENLNKQALEKVIAKLNIQGRTGKLTFAKTLGMERFHTRKVEKLSDLRNTLVHNIGEIAAFNFQDHISTLNEGEAKNWAAIYTSFSDTENSQDENQDILAKFKAEPKSVVFVSMLFTAAMLCMDYEMFKISNAQDLFKTAKELARVFGA